MATDNGIEVEGLVRVFGDDIRAVDGVDLSVAPGEIYGFLGPNGAGKSTMVLMLVTLLPPTSGRATVAGFDVAKQGPEVRGQIGAALQESALDDFLTGTEHMDLQGGLHGLSKNERRTRGAELMERVGLSDAAGRKVGGYSGGMKRRLDLALALLHRPSVLFLDEPTTGLDPQSRSALWAEAGIGQVSLEATPANPNDREKLAAALERFGEPAAASPKSVAVRLAAGAEQLADVVRALDADGIEVAELQLHQPSLDDVFLQQTGRSLEGEEEAEPAS